MYTGFIYAPQGKNISYYKTFTGKISFIRSYNNNNNTKIHLDVDDFENNNTLLENTIDENITGYRQLCMKDDKGNNILISLKFIYNNLTVLMKHLGATDDFNVSKYSITDDDCFAVNFSAITNACDLPSNESVIPIIKNRIVYYLKAGPTKIFSESEKFSVTNHFSQSNILSDSKAFTDWGVFSNSKSFLNSLSFSNSNDFINSNCFSKYNEFSYTKTILLIQTYFLYLFNSQNGAVFHQIKQTSNISSSSQFSDSFTFSGIPTQSLYGEMHSMLMHLTYSYIRIVTFSISYIKSYSYSICINNDLNSYTFCQIESPTPDYFPYILTFSFLHTIISFR